MRLAFVRPIAFLAVLASAVSLDVASAASDGQVRVIEPPDDSKPHHVERTAGRQLELTLEGELIAPRLRAREWLLYAAAPSDHAFQKVEGVRLEARCGADSEWASAEGIEEESSLERSMLFARLRPEEVVDRVQYRLRIQLQSYALQLQLGEPEEKVRKLPGKVRRTLTAETPLHDFKHPRMKAWIRERKLKRQRGEGNLAYAYRVLDVIGREFEYAYPPRFPERLASQVVEEGASDCGGLSALFVSVLRSEGVPARVLVGRWTLPGHTDQQCHVKAEFFAESVGWVPIDGSGAVSWKNGVDDAFGRSKGEFVVMHEGAEVIVDPPGLGERSLTWCQGVACYATGSGDFQGMQEPSTWTVRVLSPADND